MLESFCKDKLAPLALRLAIGLFFVYHGYLKIMAGGGTTWYPGMSTFWQVVISWGEFSSGLAILLGFRCRAFAALGMALFLGTLILSQGWKIARMPVANLEPLLLLVLMASALVCLGSGEISLDGRGNGKALGGKSFRK